MELTTNQLALILISKKLNSDIEFNVRKAMSGTIYITDNNNKNKIRISNHNSKKNKPNEFCLNIIIKKGDK